MGKIKSALEIALERTESVKSNKSSIDQFAAKQKGKKLANDFIEGNIKSLDDEIKKEPKDDRASLVQGIYDVLISRIALPAGKEELAQVEAAGRGLNVVLGAKRFGETVKQLGQLLNQYLDETAQYEEAIKKQYAPKLKQKEEEIAKRLGRAVKLDPFQDQEFVTFYNQHINALKANYQSVIDQVKEEAANLFEDK